MGYTPTSQWGWGYSAQGLSTCMTGITPPRDKGLGIHSLFIKPPSIFLNLLGSIFSQPPIIMTIQYKFRIRLPSIVCRWRSNPLSQGMCQEQLLMYARWTWLLRNCLWMDYSVSLHPSRISIIFELLHSGWLMMTDFKIHQKLDGFQWHTHRLQTDSIWNPFRLRLTLTYYTWTSIDWPCTPVGSDGFWLS